MMKLFADIMTDEGNTLSCLYKLSPPDPAIVKARDAKVKAMIKQMGNRYLLAKVHLVKRDE